MKRALVFDSGVGGLSVVRALRATNAALTLDYVADAAWLPYGEKPDSALRERIPALLAALAARTAPDVVILACNTASTLALEEARAALSCPVVGVVPAIKPAAAMTRSGVIGLLATPATVRRAYTDKLIFDHAAEITVLRAGSADFVLLAEQVLTGAPADPRRIEAALAPFKAHPRGADMDVLVLACTHFPLLAQALAAALPGVRLIDSGEAVARRALTVIGLAPDCGVVRCDRAFVTAAAGQAPPQEAYLREGFAAVLALQPQPPFADRDF